MNIIKKINKTAILMFCFGIFTIPNAFGQQNKFTINGYIKDATNGEELIGATVSIPEIKIGAISNAYGYYSISVPAGSYHVIISYMGFKSQNLTLEINESLTQNIQMLPNENLIDEVNISAERKDQNTKSNEMSTNKLQMKTISKIPALMGEVDILRSIQMLPGVHTSGEGSIGFFVRGGGVDQNLILLDEATVYNASHLGGIFSVFNQDVIKDVTLSKGGIPAVYGGRLSSILDIRMKEGNLKKLNITGGIGIISSRLTIEAPIVKDKASFILSGRRTYFDLFFPFLADSVIKDSKAYFYDTNLKFNYQFNENNRIFISGYFGKDVIQMGELMRMDYGNKTLTARYNHLFSKKLFSNLSFIYSVFDYGIGFSIGNEVYDWESGINDISLKNDYSWFVNPKNTIRFGFNLIHHTFNPGKVSTVGDGNNYSGKELPKSYALESGLFIENDQIITQRISARYGLRFSMFQNIGPFTSYIFDKTNPQEYTVIGSVLYGKNDFFNPQFGLEPRINLKFELSPESSIKLSYNHMVQYLHLTTNTMSTTPLDLWSPSSPNIKPQKADQVSMGYFRNFASNVFETSIEVYYKKMNNSVDFADHAELLLNEYMEGELRFGSAYSYGLELFLRKQSGKFTGWISYNFSRVFQKIPENNGGLKYPAHYDKPNDMSIVLSYDFSSRLNVSLNWVYSTGAPRTFPTGKVPFGNTIYPEYTRRNNGRLEDYHRMDAAITYYFSKTKSNGEPKKFTSSLNLSIYNLYNRHNTYAVTFNVDELNPSETVATKIYLFPIIPTITYNFNFN